MHLYAFRVAENCDLQRCEPEETLSIWRGGADTPCWLHVTGFESAELATWLAPLQLSEFVERRILRIERFTKVIPATDALIIELRILSEQSSEAPRQLALLCLKNLLISFERVAPPAGEAAVARPEQLQLEKRSTAGLLLSLLLMQLDRTSAEVHRANSAIVDLDHRLERDPESASLREILDAKDHLLSLLAVAEEQSECFAALNVTESQALDFEELQGSRSLLLCGAASTERMAARLEKRVADLRQRYDTLQQEKTNRRLAILTLISAVFLPLGLLAGIWGMNFEFMPELRYPFAYPAALALMAILAGGMLWFFRRRGWFE